MGSMDGESGFQIDLSVPNNLIIISVGLHFFSNIFYKIFVFFVIWCFFYIQNMVIEIKSSS